MPLTHTLLKGSPRLLEAYENRGRRSVKRSPPDEPDAIVRIQKAMLILEGQRDLKSCFPNGFDKEPTGVFNLDLFNVVIGFQKRVFPGEIFEHDGRVGKKTLDAMERELWQKDGPNAKLIDLEPKDLLVFMTGFADDPDPAKDLGGVVFSDAAKGGPQAMDFAKVRRGSIPARFLGVFGSLNKKGGIEAVVESVMRDFDPTRKLIMYGFSAGAANLLEVCRRIDSRNEGRSSKTNPPVQVDLLVTNDAAAKEGTAGIKRETGKCVKKNVNLFQNLSMPGGSHGGENSGLGCTPVNIPMNQAAVAEAARKNKEESNKPPELRVTWTPHGVMQHLAHPKAMEAIRGEMR